MNKEVKVERDKEGNIPRDKIKVRIIDAKFLKDADAGGITSIFTTDKQDVRIEFKYQGKTWKTDTIDEAGLEATFEQEFILDELSKELLDGKTTIKFIAYDVDVGFNDVIGISREVDFKELMLNADE